MGKEREKKREGVGVNEGERSREIGREVKEKKRGEL
jgi:hypothetical protein